MLPHATSWIYILIWPSDLRLDPSSDLFPSVLLNKPLYAPLLCPVRAKCPAHVILLYSVTRKISCEKYRTSAAVWNDPWHLVYGEELSLRPTPKLEDSPLSAVRDCLFNTFAATLHIRNHFLYTQPDDAPRCGNRDSLITERLITSSKLQPVIHRHQKL